MRYIANELCIRPSGGRIRQGQEVDLAPDDPLVKHCTLVEEYVKPESDVPKDPETMSEAQAKMSHHPRMGGMSLSHNPFADMPDSDTTDKKTSVSRRRNNSKPNTQK